MYTQIFLSHTCTLHSYIGPQLSKYMQMADDINFLLTKGVTSETCKSIRLGYGGQEYSFLTKIIKPMYNVIRKVAFCLHGVHMATILKALPFIDMSIFSNWLWIYGFVLHAFRRLKEVTAVAIQHGGTMMIWTSVFGQLLWRTVVFHRCLVHLRPNMTYEPWKQVKWMLSFRLALEDRWRVFWKFWKFSSTLLKIPFCLLVAV